MKFVYPADVKPRVVRNRKDMGEWGAQPCEHTWKELCKAAESLDPSKQPLLRKRRASAVDGSDIHGAHTLLIKTSKLEVYKEKFTDEDFKSFERVVKRARQDLDLHKNYLSNTEIIKHYSSVERVKEKIPRFNLIHDWEVEALVQAIENYNNCISRQRKLEEERYLKRMKILPIGFDTPIHFLVRQRDEGCCIQEPLLELTKIRAYFGCFLITS